MSRFLVFIISFLTILLLATIYSCNYHSQNNSVIDKSWIIKVDSIDIETLIDHGEFLTDKNRVYRKYDTSDGTIILELEKVDRNSFRTIGSSIYAKDINYVFDSRHGIIEMADPRTFDTIRFVTDDGAIIYGKDKFNYYFWNEIIKLDTIDNKIRSLN